MRYSTVALPTLITTVLAAPTGSVKVNQILELAIYNTGTTQIA